MPPGNTSSKIGKTHDFWKPKMRALPLRHRSIRAVFDTSWTRLTDVERDVFMKLSVFRGGFTREAAQAVAGASLKTLTTLVNKSLIRRDSQSGRYEDHEVLTQYAEQRLKESSGLEAAGGGRRGQFTPLLVP